MGLGIKYLKKREAVMKKHPMAYLYAAKRAGLTKRQARRSGR